jgi:transcriptional regulator with XRE-family HTH domain
MGDCAQIVALNIRRIRARRRITQQSLANLAGINKTHMHRIECGSSSMRLNTLERIARALGVQMASLLRGCL